jgi:hypothetical protein
MNALGLMLLLAAAEPDDGLSKKMLPIYLKDAEEYTIAVESAPRRALELKKEPVFEWQNPTRDGVQQGAVFVWLRDGRPAALGCIFSHPYGKAPARKVNHELHALDPEKLLVTRDNENQWKPEAGLVRQELTDGPAPAETPAARQIQIKKLAAEFTGSEIAGAEKRKLDLRLLPTPLYKYPSAKTGVLDGALFALVSEAGTDPEVLLVVEARAVEGKVRWEFACGRFSDLELHVQRKDREVFASIRGETNTALFGPQHLYRFYADKVVTPDGKLVARMRSTKTKPFGEIIPVKQKDPHK